MLLLRFLLSCLSITAAHAVTSSLKPNILLIFPDQWRFDWGGPYFSVPVQTPNFEFIAESGTMFRRAVVASPLCAPSRGCLAAGKEYDMAGVPSNFANDYPINQTTFYKVLRDEAGYHVMTCGKDDLTKKSQPGLNGSYHAIELGFSDWLRSSGKFDVIDSSQPHEPYGVFLNSIPVSATPPATLWDIHKKEYKSDCQWRSYVCNKSSPMPDYAYEDNWIALNGLKLLQRKPPGKPWYLQVNIAGPHPPFAITENMTATVRGRQFPLAIDHTTLTNNQQQIVREDYAAEIENIDHWIGMYLTYLNSTGELNNTLVCVSSDHGEMLGDHDDWGKTQPWSGSVGVPLICMGQKLGVRVGAVIEKPITTMDLAGTFIDYAGVKPVSGMTTKSLRSILEGKSDQNRDFIWSGLSNWREVIQWKDEKTIYKLICCNGTCPGQPKNTITDQQSWSNDKNHEDDCNAYSPQLQSEVCKTEEKLMYNRAASGGKTTVLLYNIAEDPYEMNNLAQSESSVVNDMLKLLPAGKCPQ